MDTVAIDNDSGRGRIGIKRYINFYSKKDGFPPPPPGLTALAGPASFRFPSRRAGTLIVTRGGPRAAAARQVREAPGGPGGARRCRPRAVPGTGRALSPAGPPVGEGLSRQSSAGEAKGLAAIEVRRL